MIGRQVSHYEITARIGSGGMGEVYRARDLHLDRTVVLKFLPPARAADQAARERFHREARAASALDHPSICTIFDIDEADDGTQFICMAHCDGETLAERLASGPLPPDVAAHIALRVAEGLVCAHRNGVVHRDLKPANIQLTADGGVKILDFGVARLAGQEQLTTEGTALGTLPYMSPEQARGRDVDDRSDLWSLGVILFEMLTGRRPFRGDGISDLVLAIATERVPDPTAIDPDIPADLADLVYWCLEKDPTRRPPAATAMVDTLATHLRALRAEPTQMLPTSRAQRAARRRRRWWPALVGLFAAVAVVAGLMVAGVVPPGRGTGSRGVALLPWTVIGGDEIDQRLGAGLVQHLTDELLLLEPYQQRRWVAPLSIVRRRDVRGTDTARGRLGVGSAVGGTLQIQGDVLTAKLLVHDTGGQGLRRLSRPSPQRTVVGSRSDLVAWTDGIRVALIDLLGWQPTPDGRRPPTAGHTHNSASLTHYLHGLGQMRSSPDLRADVTAAWSSFEASLAVDPGFSLAHVGLAHLSWWGREGHDPDSDAALAACDAALALTPDLLDALFLKGRILRRQGEPEAVDVFRRCLTLTPGHWPSAAQIGECFVDIGEVDSTEAYLRHAVESKPDFAPLRNELGWLYFYIGNLEAARDEFSRVITLTPDNVSGFTNLGSVAYRLERWDEAEAMYQRALALKPDPTVYGNLGAVYFYQHRFLAAAGVFEAAMELAPREPGYHSWTADCYWWQGDDLQRAYALYRQAADLAESHLVVHPADQLNRAILASCLIRLGDATRAGALLDEIAAADSTDPVVHYLLASGFEDLGDRGRAVRHVATALRGGYVRWEIERYPGFDRLRHSSEYLTMLAELEAGGAADDHQPDVSP